LITQGKAVPLAVSTPDRLQSLPGLPTLKELGYSIPYLRGCGLSAPAKTPREIVTKINGVVANVLAMPAVRTKLLRTGYMPAPMNPEEYARFVADDVAQMISLGKEAHIEPKD
jgi:tripartite-type tricarboxylate transporter receptor subunit TctC